MEEKICQQRRTLIKFAGSTALLSMLPPTFARASEINPVGETDGPRQQLYADATASAGVGLEEAFPIGNGRMGGLVGGGAAQEKLWFNESSLWSGDSNPAGKLDGGTFGAYEYPSWLTVDFTGIGETALTNYQRTLDLELAQSEVTFESDGVTYTRQSFCSSSDQVLVMRFSADKPAALSGTIKLMDNRAKTVVDSASLAAGGSLQNGEKYATAVYAVHDEGSMAKSSGGLVFTNVTILTLFIAVTTNYSADAKGWKFGSDDPMTLAKSRTTAAATTDFAKLVQRHRDDYSALFDRVSLNLGPSTPQQRANPTVSRLRDNVFAADPELITLYFQYARYLMISCSRRGGLPANKEGLWTIGNNVPGSFGDYHADVDFEMNYWLAEPGNLTECFAPFPDFIQRHMPAWRAATRANPLLKKANGSASRGWAVRVDQNIYGGMAGNWDLTANAWYCRQLYDHYAFTMDTDYLAKIAYPIMKEVCQFFQDTLITNKLSAGMFVVSGVAGGWSPEHGPQPGTAQTDGCTYNQELVWDVVNNSIAAIDVLGIDSDFRAQLVALRDKLYLPTINPVTGQLREWMTDIVDPDPKSERYIPNLIGLYPGERIASAGDPALMAAAREVLIARPSAPTGRSVAWRIACWAMLGDGEAAYQYVQKLLPPVHFVGEFDYSLYTNGVYANLFAADPPFQIAANFGGAAAIIEMLVQSHMGKIILLPALPAAWPSGSIKGVRLRGGFEADISWHDGELQGAEVRSVGGYSTTVFYDAGSVEITPPKQGRGLLLNRSSFTCKP